MLSEITIRCFLHVAQHLSFTKSSQDLFMSRQAVSKQILLMEERLGVKLFDRTTNQVELTAEGRQYQAFFTSVVNDFEMMFGVVNQASMPRRQIQIGYMIGLLIDQRIIDVFGDHKRRRTAAALMIERHDVLDIETRLLNGQLDMAFTYIPLEDKKYKDFSYIILEHAEYVIAASKNHPRVNENTTYSDFDGERAIYWKLNDSDDAVCRRDYIAIWRDIGITVIPARQCTLLSSAYSELLLGNVVMLCDAKSEICMFPGILTYPLPKRENFGCVLSSSACAEAKELTESFRKYEIPPYIFES